MKLIMERVAKVTRFITLDGKWKNANDKNLNFSSQTSFVAAMKMQQNRSEVRR